MIISRLVTDCKEFVESEFIRRESGLEFEFVDLNRQDLRNPRNIYGTLTGNLDYWHSFLKSAPQKSIVIFLIGNEYYKPELFKPLDSFSSSRHAFVQYLPTQRQKFHLFFLVPSLMEMRPPINLKKLVSTLFRSIETFRQMKKLQINTPHTFLPSGYTNRFVSEVTRKFRGLDVSLFFADINFGNVTKDLEVVSLGQMGSFARRLLVSQFSKCETNKVVTHSGWGVS